MNTGPTGYPEVMKARDVLLDIQSGECRFMLELKDSCPLHFQNLAGLPLACDITFVNWTLDVRVQVVQQFCNLYKLVN